MGVPPNHHRYFRIFHVTIQRAWGSPTRPLASRWPPLIWYTYDNDHQVNMIITMIIMMIMMIMI